MAKKFKEEALRSLLKGSNVACNKESVKALGVDILEVEPYESNGTRYLNGRYDAVKMEMDYFTVNITISVNEAQAKKIEDLCKDSYKEFKANAAINALVAAGFTTEQAQAILKKKGK